MGCCSSTDEQPRKTPALSETTTDETKNDMKITTQTATPTGQRSFKKREEPQTPDPGAGNKKPAEENMIAANKKQLSVVQDAPDSPNSTDASNAGSPKDGSQNGNLKAVSPKNLKSPSSSSEELSVEDENIARETSGSIGKKGVRFIDTRHGHSKHDSVAKKHTDRAVRLDLLLEDHQSHRQEGQSVKQLFDRHATVKSVETEDEFYMSEEELERALVDIGLRVPKYLKERLHEYFNLETREEMGSKNKCIDYFDFSSALSAFVSGDDEEGAYLMFGIHDHDDDGFLDVDDLALLLLSEHNVAAVVQGGVDSNSTLDKDRLYKRAEKLLIQGDTGVSDNKISFDEFMSIRGSRDERKMLIDRQRSTTKGDADANKQALRDNQ